MSSETGTVLLVRPEAVLESLSNRPVKITETVVLTRASGMERARNVGVDVPWFGGVPTDFANPLDAKVFSTADTSLDRIAEVVDFG